jgi:hypothetical protein
MTADEILTRLTEIARLIESHQAAVFLLKHERSELQAELRSAGWQPPEWPEKRA